RRGGDRQVVVVPGQVVGVGGVADAGVGGPQRLVQRGVGPQVGRGVGLGRADAQAGVVELVGVGDRPVHGLGGDDVDEAVGVVQVILVDGEPGDVPPGLENDAVVGRGVVGVGRVRGDRQTGDR